MPLLRNAKHERFAQELAAGKTPEAAYAEAGFKPHRQNAHRLMTNDDIQSRVAELQERAAEGVQITRQWVIEKLVENVKTCMTMDFVRGPDGVVTPAVTHNPAAANKALELLGKELGMFVDRSENTHITYDLSDDLPTADEWAESYSTAH